MYISVFKHLLITIMLCYIALSCLHQFPLKLRYNKLATGSEICDNAIDDDQDGLIDLNDPDCNCEIIEPVSLIPNPSFEDLDCCPDNRSQLNCAVSWVQASQPTTDLIHMCDWMGWDEFPPPLPFPDGEGVMGFRDGRVRGSGNPEPNWKEYAGACLLGPMLKDSAYRFEFDVGFVNSASSPPIDITFFGSTACSNLPFGIGNEAFGCPTNGPGWKRLGSVLVSGGRNSGWVKASIEIIPEEDIQAIVIGPDCPPVDNPTSTYYFFDNLLLADLRAFSLKVEEVTHPCNELFSLKIRDDAGLTYQWYKAGIALPGETSSQLNKMYGEGVYQVRIFDGNVCRVSKGYLHKPPVTNKSETKVICMDDIYTFGDQQLSASGVYVDTFKTTDNCDSIVTLDLKVLGALADTIQVKILAGTSYEVEKFSFDEPGDHLVTLTSAQGCDSLVLLQLSFFNIFIPNVFSPNYDGVNDAFKVFGGDDLIASRDLTILDRWGAVIYEGPEWDGTYKGQLVSPGVFLYFVKLQMSNGTVKEVVGSVTVIR